MRRGRPCRISSKSGWPIHRFRLSFVPEKKLSATMTYIILHPLQVRATYTSTFQNWETKISTHLHFLQILPFFLWTVVSICKSGQWHCKWSKKTARIVIQGHQLQSKTFWTPCTDSKFACFTHRIILQPTPRTGANLFQELSTYPYHNQDALISKQH